MSAMRCEISDGSHIPSSAFALMQIIEANAIMASIFFIILNGVG
jgi:hypothetical protein